MRILTVRQPWAWAIMHGGKDVENRGRNIAGSYRGPIAIHAGLTAVDHGDALWDVERFRSAIKGSNAASLRAMDVRGGIIGVVDLVDVHRGHWSESCSPWAEDDAHHLVLRNPRPLADPIPYRGALGLRPLDDATTAAVLESIT